MPRLKNAKNKTKKYVVKQYNHKLEEWEEIGKYTSFAEIGKKLKLSRHTVQNIKLGRSKKYNKFFSIKLAE